VERPSTTSPDTDRADQDERGRGRKEKRKKGEKMRNKCAASTFSFSSFRAAMPREGKEKGTEERRRVKERKKRGEDESYFFKPLSDGRGGKGKE